MRHVGLGTFEATPKMRELISRVLDTARLSYGPLSQEFERRFAEMHGCQYGVLSNSGTSSLLTALQTLKELHGWQDGDEVICPALTFVATVNIVLQLRLKPVLVDIEPDYYGIDVSKIEAALTDKTRGIIPVHTFGQPVNVPEIGWLLTGLKAPAIKILVDSCESMLVDKNIDNWTAITCFSTYIAHLLVTGVGGIATTNNPDYAGYMKSLVNHGIDLSELPTGEPYDTSWLARKFRFDKVGHSFRTTELESALGLAQLDDLPAIICQRQKNAAYLTAGLQGLEDRLQLPKVRPHTEHAFMMYCLVCRQEGVRDELMRYLAESGIETRLALPLTRQPCYKGLWNPDEFVVADWMNRNAFYTSCHQGLTEEDLGYIVEKVREFFNGR